MKRKLFPFKSETEAAKPDRWFEAPNKFGYTR